MDKLFIPVEITNMEELKKLINRAGYQIDQLKDTLEKIEK
ncbi:AsnC family transcriptional regulator, partial [Enterococcus gallinarum]|nr:AsnC family transcriptional regulator [Enterococcus gallinarum]NQE04193.1 AsnC family transcriptional regulator [Enterococcus gallinarum]